MEEHFDRFAVDGHLSADTLEAFVRAGQRDPVHSDCVEKLVDPKDEDDPLAAHGHFAAEAGAALARAGAGEHLVAAFDGDGDGFLNFHESKQVHDLLQIDARESEDGLSVRRAKLLAFRRTAPGAWFKGSSALIDGSAAEKRNLVGLRASVAGALGYVTDVDFGRSGIFSSLKPTAFAVRFDSGKVDDHVLPERIELLRPQRGGLLERPFVANQRHPYSMHGVLGPDSTLLASAETQWLARLCGRLQRNAAAPCGPIPACLCCFWLHACILCAPCVSLAADPLNHAGNGERTELQLWKAADGRAFLRHAVRAHGIYKRPFVMAEMERLGASEVVLDLSHVDSVDVIRGDSVCCCLFPSPAALSVRAFGVQVATLEAVGNADSFARQAVAAKDAAEPAAQVMDERVEAEAEAFATDGWIGLERLRLGLPMHAAAASGGASPAITVAYAVRAVAAGAAAPSAPGQSIDELGADGGALFEVLRDLDCAQYLPQLQRKGVDLEILAELDEGTLSAELGIDSRIDRLKILQWARRRRGG